MYFPWEVGKEFKALIEGDTLNFIHGRKLHLPVEYTSHTPVRNPGTEPLNVVLEPWGIRHTLAPGESATIVSQGRYADGEPIVNRVAGELVFEGWNGSWATIVTDPPPPAPPKPPTPPQPTKPTTPPQAPNVEASEPAAETPVKPTVKPQVKPPAPFTPARPSVPKFEPRTPSPELAALLRKWVDELPPSGSGTMIERLCRENDAIPLYCNVVYLYVLRTDGQVLCIDHESFAQRAEPEENADVAYGKIAIGAETHPELLELLPPERRGGQTDE